MLVTDHQTAGRGRQQRTWHDDPGNAMLMSVLLRPPVEVASLIPLLQGVAVVEALTELAASVTARDADGSSGLEPPKFGLKWPNDVLVASSGERKLAGILAEAVTTQQPEGIAVVLGTGLNLRWSTMPPADIAARAITLEEVLGGAVDRWEVVNVVLGALDRWLTVLYQQGADGLLPEYERRCLTLGRSVAFSTAGTDGGQHGTVVRGIGAGIRGDGALRIATDTGEVVVMAGDAHHVP